MPVETSAQLQDKYGDELAQPPFSDVKTGYMLRKALGERKPPVAVTHQVCREWIKKYRLSGGAETVGTADELQQKYGDCIRHLVVECPTAYKFREALRNRTPPLYVSKEFARHG